MAAGASILRQNRDADSTRRAVKRWRRRSLFILFWRGALPTLMGVGLLGLAVVAGIRTFAQLHPSERGASDIRMVNPEFQGRDKKGQPYVITADSAVRDPHHYEHVALTEPRLTMQTTVNGELKAQAHTGQYDEQSKILTLAGEVIADTAKGDHFRSPTARIDTVADQIEGHDGVVASSPLGQTTGANYTADDKTGHVQLTGSVHTHLYPHGGQSPGAASSGPKGKE